MKRLSILSLAMVLFLSLILNAAPSKTRQVRVTLTSEQAAQIKAIEANYKAKRKPLYDQLAKLREEEAAAVDKVMTQPPEKK